MEDCEVNNLSDMIWIEMRKAIRSRVPLWTAVGSLFMPLGIAFLIFLARNPDIAKNLGLVGAKANLVSYSATDWPAYMGFFAQIIAAGGFILFVIIISWVFGREFVDGTLKDMLAVPVQRSSIILAKFFIMAVWSAALTIIIIIVGLILGAIIKIPGGSISVILHNSGLVLITAILAVMVVTPFALFASVGRGYLLPLGLAILVLMMTNFLVIIGWGEYIPFSVPGLYAVGKTPLTGVSYWIVLLTGLAGIIATYLWWKFADQNR